MKNFFLMFWNRVPGFIQNVFKSWVNVVLLIMLVVVSVMDLCTEKDLTGGITFCGVVLFAYMIQVSLWRGQAIYWKKKAEDNGKNN